MKNYVESSWGNEVFGEVIFITDPVSIDSYTVRVREKWSPDIEVFLVLELLAGKSGTILDLGANIGTWCLPICIGSELSCLAVEALPGNLELLQLAIERNGLANRVQTVHAAIWNEDGHVRLSGASAYGVVNDAGDVDVVARSLDSLYAQGVFGSPLLIKIDIEGCERKALEGATEVLKTMPDIIFEGNGAHSFAQGYLPQDIVADLIAAGYKVYMIVGNSLIPADGSSFQPFGLINYLATINDLAGLSRFKVGVLSQNAIRERVEVAMTKMKSGYKKFMIAQSERPNIEIREDIRTLISDLALIR